jgi:hypothetical protein
MNLLKKTWVRGATGKESSMEHNCVEDSKQPRVHLPLEAFNLSLGLSLSSLILIIYGVRKVFGDSGPSIPKKS